jgi:hypothetical protein
VVTARMPLWCRCTVPPCTPPHTTHICVALSSPILVLCRLGERWWWVGLGGRNVKEGEEGGVDVSGVQDCGMVKRQQ